MALLPQSEKRWRFDATCLMQFFFPCAHCGLIQHQLYRIKKKIIWIITVAMFKALCHMSGLELTEWHFVLLDIHKVTLNKRYRGIKQSADTDTSREEMCIKHKMRGISHIWKRQYEVGIQYEVCWGTWTSQSLFVRTDSQSIYSSQLSTIMVLQSCRRTVSNSKSLQRHDKVHSVLY